MVCRQMASDGRCREFGELSWMECTGQRNEFELIPMVKIETRHPVEDHLVMKFHRSTAELRQPDVARCWKKIFCAFYGKKTPYEKIFKILFRQFLIATTNDVLCSNFVQFGQWKVGKIVCCLPDKLLLLLRPFFQDNLGKPSKPAPER